MSTYTGVTNFQKTARFFESPCTLSWIQRLRAQAFVGFPPQLQVQAPGLAVIGSGRRKTGFDRQL